MIRRRVRAPIGALLGLIFLAGPIVQAQPQAGAPAQLIGSGRTIIDVGSELRDKLEPLLLANDK